MDFGKKEAVFTEEISRLQESLKAERAAVAEARKDNGDEGKRGLEGYRKWVQFVFCSTENASGLLDPPTCVQDFFVGCACVLPSYVPVTSFFC